MIDDRRQLVLIADDDPSIRRMLALALEKEGYRTNDARDGGEALAAMRAGQVDLVLLDLMMPRVTGWEVLHERAAAPDLRKIPVIVITAGRGDAVANVPVDGLCALLPKPFELDALRALVKSCLDRG
ncbi:MAG TPA: response regulator [Thermoanaerobaculia bacterium]|nr:response regulator [Thermoanaerobaculia bacterium]